MRIDCLHGYFKFHETRAGEISEFASLFAGLQLVAKDDYFTFDFLRDAPDFSIAGLNYLGTPAIVNFEGKPWDVFFENELVYNFQTDKVVPISTVVQKAVLQPCANYYLSPGLILPGSVTDDGSRVTDYAAWYFFDTNKFKYSEVSFV